MYNDQDQHLSTRSNNVFTESAGRGTVPICHRSETAKEVVSKAHMTYTEPPRSPLMPARDDPRAGAPEGSFEFFLDMGANVFSAWENLLSCTFIMCLFLYTNRTSPTTQEEGKGACRRVSDADPELCRLGPLHAYGYTRPALTASGRSRTPS